MPLPPVRNRVDISKQLEDAKQKVAKKKAPAPPRKPDPNDIFTDKDLKDEGGKPKEEVKYKRDVSAMPDYYKAWDNFDVDKALDSEDEEEKNKASKITYKEPEPVRSQADMMRLTSGAKPNTKIVIKGGTQALNADAEHLKSQGNSYFQSLDYVNAAESYTRCLTRLALDDTDTPATRDMQKIVLSNRAQSYLKLKRYQEAETDADEALAIDAEHVKSLQRRGTARYYIGRLRGAAKDFEKAQKLQFT